MAEGIKLGEWAFIIGVLIAIVIGIFVKDISQLVDDAKAGKDTQFYGWLVLLLVVMGLAVGLMNISEKETTPFLVATAALLITGTQADTLLIIKGVGKYLVGIVTAISVFVVPAAVIVALKSIRALAKD